MLVGISLLLIFLGALAQGASGVGLGLVAGPFVAMLAPALVPGPMLVIMVVAASWTAWSDRHAVEWRWALSALIMRAPGVLLGAWLFTLMSPQFFAWAFAFTVLAGVLLSLISSKHVPNTKNLALGGFFSGIMGTITSVGSPPMIFVMQHGQPSIVRATLSIIFAVGSTMSIIGLAMFGQFGIQELFLGLTIVPPMLLGIWLSRYLRQYIDRGALRPLLLGLAALAAPLLILRAMTMG